MKKCENLTDLVQYIRAYILDMGTVDTEPDDFEIHFYDDEIAFTVNEIYDGLSYIYDFDKDEVRVVFPEGRCKDIEIAVEGKEALQMAQMLLVLNENKDLLKVFKIIRM